MSSMSLEKSSGDGPGRRKKRLLDDPLAIRALAHPLRIELQAILARSGRLTAADAARELGISQALASHHLRQLAKYGFVEQTEGDDNRARPWRATSTSQTWSNAEDREVNQAASVLEQVLAERALSRFTDWQERRADWPASWRKHTGIGQHTMRLTRGELAELAQAIGALVDEYVDRHPVDDPRTLSEDAVAVDLTLFTTLLDDPPDRD